VNLYNAYLISCWRNCFYWNCWLLRTATNIVIITPTVIFISFDSGARSFQWTQVLRLQLVLDFNSNLRPLRQTF